ncbi:MAG: TetR/AcrR family transcriptional regulator [Cellulomonas iranensis]|uniref:AcrR family transcriptional regulator n=1 Tax=Cellulomonas iranensis TaxID=76862 RepID=A0ABU0GMF8_9CELL|nr:TetR/AcrR family transcriptional regulator [Cellulomonas iranensis]MBO9569003.1 TetR/AcrR family transcriptional regulator [Cellulomonas iranensis]MDQ0425916.1 AcrR family transcriptional regulator [Cellulomonas iranensis]
MPTARTRPRVRMDGPRRRDQILAAATALIAERGYWGLSTQDVADACDMTVPGLLHHVGSKTGLLVAVLERRDALDALAIADRLGVPHGPGRGIWGTDLFTAAGVTLDVLCDHLVQHNATQPEVVRLYAVLEAESLTPDHPAHAYFADRQRTALAALAAVVPPPHDPDHLASVALGLMDGLQLQWLRDPTTSLVDRWRAAVADVPGLRVPA